MPMHRNDERSGHGHRRSGTGATSVNEQRVIPSSFSLISAYPGSVGEMAIEEARKPKANPRNNRREFGELEDVGSRVRACRGNIFARSGTKEVTIPLTVRIASEPDPDGLLLEEVSGCTFSLKLVRVGELFAVCIGRGLPVRRIPEFVNQLLAERVIKGHLRGIVR